MGQRMLREQEINSENNQKLICSRDEHTKKTGYKKNARLTSTKGTRGDKANKPNQKQNRGLKVYQQGEKYEKEDNDIIDKT